jgi:hypothetical protein
MTNQAENVYAITLEHPLLSPLHKILAHPPLG